MRIKGRFPAGFSAKRFLILFLSIGLAVGGTLGLKNWTFQHRPTEQVLVAGRDIAPYSVISSQDLGYVTLPAGAAQPDALQDPKNVVGRVALTEIFKGEQLWPQKLGNSPLLLGPDERQIALPVDAVRAVGLAVAPGDKVDVYWTPKPGGGNNNAATDVVPGKLVAEGATIIDLRDKNGRSVLNGAGANPPAAYANNQNQPAPAIAVLKVKNSEAPVLSGAMGAGSLTLVKKGMA